MEYHKLRPKELVRVRNECSVAYLGLGILEWHGFHNPVGLDGIKAHAALKHLADRVGGLVMPPLYWGDHRGHICEVVFDPAVSEWLPPGTTDHSSGICHAMGLSRDRMEEEGRRSQENGGWQLWKDLVVHIFFQVESLGMKTIVPYPGHYPLIEPLDAAIRDYKLNGGSCDIFVLKDQLIAEGDHAARFETSLLLALCPELVDMNELDAGADQHLGVLGEDPLKTATAEYGRQILTEFERLLAQHLGTVESSG